MDTNNQYTGFEKLLKDKLDNFEYSYKNNDWLDFKKKLPKSTSPFISPKNFIRTLVITTAVVVPIIAILYFYNNSGKQNNNNMAVSNNHKNYNNSNSGNNNQSNEDIQSSQNTGNYSQENKSNLTNDNASQENKSKLTNKDNKDNINKNNPLANNSSKNSENEKPVLNKNISNNPMNSGYISVDIRDGCIPLKVKFTPAIISDSISYQWIFGDSKTSTKKVPTHIYNKPGLYTVSLTVKFKKSGLVKKIDYADFINAKSAPIAKFSYTIDNETDVYTFTDNSSNATLWNWTLGDNTTSKLQNPQHEYNLDGTYNVKLITINGEGCPDTSITSIAVKNKPPFYLPTGYNPSDGYFGPTGIDMNPDGYKFSIYSRSGKLVFETTRLDEKWDGKIKDSNTDAPAGVYVCKITMKNKHGILQDYWPLDVTLMR